MDFHKTLKKSCLEFSRKTVTNVSNFLNHDLTLSEACRHIEELDQNQSLYFSMPFQGKVNGEFIFGMDLKTAVHLIGEEDCSETDFDKIKEDIFDVFKEILNWSAGQTIGFIKDNFESVTISAPRVTIGQIVFPKAPMYKSDLIYGNGKISCYIYMDSMMTDLIETLEKTQEKNKELEETHQSLIRMNQAKSQFLAHMSHELRTPLNGIIGIIDLLKSTPLNDYQNRQLETVSKSGELLLSIINDILEFSKIETGHLKLEEKPFHFRDTVESFVGTMACQVYTKGLDFYVDLPNVLPKTVVADETKLKQVLTNLVGNAIKFTPKGHIRMNFEFSEKSGTNYMKISVSDTGVGIPKDKLNTIFDSFSQADISDTRKYGGSGLGLSICQSIIEKMGGQIIVKSEEAKGSEFSFEIPISVNDFESQDPISIDKPIGFFSSNETEIESLKREVHFLTQKEPKRLKAKDIGDEILNEYSSLIIDWNEWNRMNTEQKNKLAQASFVAFFIPPNCIPDMEWNLSKLQNISYGLLVKPCLRKNLIEIIQQQPVQNLVETQQDATLDTFTEMPTVSEDGRILVVDDNAINVEVARVMLASQGFHVDVAFDGIEAVEKVNRNSYDLIIMDCQMPRMDGYEATLSIRALKDKKSQVPIIGFTANAFKEVKQKCFDSGMTDFVTKPIKKDQLMSIVEQYMRNL